MTQAQTSVGSASGWITRVLSAVNGMLQNPFQTLVALCTVQVFFWTLLPALVDTTPPADVVEGYMWGREWLLMSYKHPQFSCWMLELGRLLTGSTRWPGFLIGQISTCIALIIIYLHARDLLGTRRALASVLLLPTIFFFNSATQQYNHDLAQIPFWAAIVWALWRAVETNRLVWWLALGFAAGLGLHAKFSTAILIAFAAVWILQDLKARSRLLTFAPWAGLAVFLALAVPLALALAKVDFMPLTYATARASWIEGHRSRFYFIGVQIAAHAGLFIALFASGLLRLRSTATSSVEWPEIDPRAFRYLLWFAVGPAGTALAVSPFLGMGEAWATPMFNLSSVLAVALLGARLTDRAMLRIAISSLAITILTSTFYAGNVWVQREVKGNIRNTVWPKQEMSDRMQAIWHSAAHLPLRIVGGGNWPAMVVGVGAGDVPSIFTDLDMKHAPWITPERLAREGMLLMWQEGAKPDTVTPWLRGREVRSERFTWSPKAPPIVIDYVVVPPAGAQP